MAQRADITLSIDGTALGVLRSASVSLDLSLVDAAAEEEYGWEERLPSVRSWSAEASVFVPLRGSDAALAALKQAMVERSTVTAAMDLTGVTETGSALIGQVSLSAGVGAALEGQIQLKGTGALTAS